MPVTTAASDVMSLQTTLGADLQFRSLSATEEMARLFEFNVIALSDPATTIDPTQLLGTNASVTIAVGDSQKRYFHGIVARAGLESAQGRMVSWRLQLRPWLWLLTRRSDCRVFQNKSVPDILNQVFSAYTHQVRLSLNRTYAPRVYCVQYRETDFNFVSRLMEEEGIYYFFEHTADKHTMVVCDAASTHETQPAFETVEFRDSQDQLLEQQAITEWRHAYELSTGKVVLTDYDYLKPSTSLTVNKTSSRSTSPAALEFYDHPGLYLETSRGNALAAVRAEELDARVLRISGATTTVGGLAAGYRFTLKDHPIGSENVEHLVLSTRIEAQFAGYESGQGETLFRCRFSAMRQAHVTRKVQTVLSPAHNILQLPEKQHFHAHVSNSNRLM